MAISKENTRLLLTLSKDLKVELEQIAKEQNRSLTNLINTIIKEFVANKAKS